MTLYHQLNVCVSCSTQTTVNENGTKSSMMILSKHHAKNDEGSCAFISKRQQVKGRKEIHLNPSEFTSL